MLISSTLQAIGNGNEKLRRDSLIYIEIYSSKCVRKLAFFAEYNVGIGLIDYMLDDQDDPDTGEPLPTLGIYNYDDMDDGTKKNYKGLEEQSNNLVKNAMWLMKANVPLNSEMYSYVQNQLQSGKIDLLIDSNVAKNKLMAQSQGKRMNAVQRAEKLRPFVETDILKSQMITIVVHLSCKR